MMRARLVMAVLAVAFLGGLGVSRASADSGAATYTYLIGTGGVEGPDVAMALNGDTITMTGSGTLSVHPKTVSGGGSFTHKNAAGAVLVRGTWTATQLLSFDNYGCGFFSGGTLPPNFCGGLALIRVHLAPSAGGPGVDAVLQVNCLLGKVPAGAKEGIRLAVDNGLNFNREVSGETLFVRQ
jgi:hypothetical protein